MRRKSYRRSHSVSSSVREVPADMGSRSQELAEWKPCGQMGNMRCVDIRSRGGQLIAVFEADFQLRTLHMNAMRSCARETPGCIDVLCTKSEPTSSIVELKLANNSHSGRVAAAYFFRESFRNWAKTQVTKVTPAQKQESLAAVLPFMSQL